MAFIHKIIQGGSDFFKTFKSENKKQHDELAKLEKKIEMLTAKEKKSTATNFVFDSNSFFKFWLMGLFLVFVSYIFYQSLNVIYLIITAFIVSVAIEGIVEIFQKRIKFRGLSIVLAYLFLIVLILGSLFYIIPFLLTQLTDVITILTGNVADFKTLLETKSLVVIVQETHWLPYAMKQGLLSSLGDPTVGAGIQTKMQDNITQIVNMGTTYAREIGNIAVNFVGSFFSFITELSIVLTLSVLFSIQKSAVMKFIASLWGDKEYPAVFMRLERIYKKLGIWLKSQFFLCVFIGLTMYLSFWALTFFGIDLPNKMSLALIAALTELVPYFGPILGGSVAVLVAFVHFGWVGAAAVLAIVVVIQRLENNVLIPLLMNKTLGVNPIVIFISMILGSLIMGFVGLLLAVPISVIITLVVDGRFEEK